MTVLLVLFTFLLFILVDYLLHHRVPVRQPSSVETRTIPAKEFVAPASAYVDGFLVPENLRYHPGHSWATRESKRRVRVGIDEFAAALLGKVERVELPKPGVWIRQGQKVLSFYRNGEKTTMVSPTEGEVIEVNQEILEDPGLLRKDPYGKGWVLLVDAPDEETVSRNLVPENMVQTWMRTAVERLYALQPQLAGAVAADGGRPAEDLFQNLAATSWKTLTQEFFLTK
jgi:glycine cleavage system H lipoate-binding protein